MACARNSARADLMTRTTTPIECACSAALVADVVLETAQVLAAAAVAAAVEAAAMEAAEAEAAAAAAAVAAKEEEREEMAPSLVGSGGGSSTGYQYASCCTGRYVPLR